METNNKENSYTRESGMDVIKALATFFVVALHFYLSCGYYNSFIASKKMYVMTTGRWIFITAVPMFLMATGYFKIRKEVNRAHYMSLIPIIITYIVLCTFRMLCENAVYGKIHTLSSGVKGLLNYNAAWYVGMYVALMLICPFLNKIWHACDKREHRILLISLIAITMAYPLIPYVFPSYFQYMYPITYYFIGAYIKEYRPKVNRFILAGLVVVCVAINVLATIHYSQGLTFNAGFIGICDNGQNALTVAVTAVCIFLILYDCKITSPVVSALFKSASACSLEIYLLQAAFNAVIYTYAGRIFTTSEEYFWVFFVTVPISFICSWITAVIYKKLYSIISGFFKRK